MFLPGDITLKPGDSGDYVLELQRRLAQRELLANANLTSHYDGPTTQAVMEFQNMNGLRSDGIAGPETLRKLISIGGGDQSDASGGTSEEEEKEAEYAIDREKADEYALDEQKRQQELGNEAVWGYDAADETAQGNSSEQEAERQEDRLQQQELQENIQQQERLDQQRLNEHQLEQLQVDNQGMQAATPMDELQEKPVVEKETSPLEQETARENHAALEDSGMAQPAAAQEAAPQQERPAFGRKAPESVTEHMAATQREHVPDIAPEQPALQPERAPETPMQANSPAPQPARDPELTRTESQLSPPDKQASQQQGARLEREGVRNEGTVPEEELGNLSPDRSPAVHREQEVAR